MIFALAKFSALYPSFNRRAWTEKDGHVICEQENVKVIYEDIPILQGFHTQIDGVTCIYLDKNLRGEHLLLVFFHEIAHVILHPSVKPVAVNFYNQFKSRHEDEAEAVALVAMYPTIELPSLENQFTETDSFLNFLINKRLLIHKRFGI